MRRYRAQQVAGSSPASSTHKVPANGVILSGRVETFALTSIFVGTAINAISYFNYCNRAGSTRYVWDRSRSVYIDDGQVNYLPDFNDRDHRLLAGGPDMRALFSRRIASPRYLGAAATTTVQTKPLVATAVPLPPELVGHTATIRSRGNVAADSFDVQLKRVHGVWREIVSLGNATSRRIYGSRSERVGIRVRAHDVQGTPGPWSAPRMLSFR
jgi:hypothetical protein